MTAAPTIDLVLLQWARQIASKPSPSTAGRWPRISALLARQALEESLGRLWTSRAPGAESASYRGQLLCLREFLGDAELASRVSYTWSALSRACHYHAYELPPSVHELEDLFTTVEQLVQRVSVVV